jgi:hypothetical protein
MRLLLMFIAAMLAGQSGAEAQSNARARPAFEVPVDQGAPTFDATRRRLDYDATYRPIDPSCPALADTTRRRCMFRSPAALIEVGSDGPGRPIGRVTMIASPVGAAGGIHVLSNLTIVYAWLAPSAPPARRGAFMNAVTDLVGSRAERGSIDGTGFRARYERLEGIGFMLVMEPR